MAASARKLIVQIPAFNEEEFIGKVISLIPRELPENVTVEVLVINDGSTDETVRVAERSGADYILDNFGNKGLARAFEAGIVRCLELGADFIVNIDADLQYDPAEIPRLIGPLLSGDADIVIGDRRILSTKAFGLGKRIFQWVGSLVVSSLAGQRVPDAVSGFRAYSRDAAIDLNILSDFSYTTESIIQAGAERRRIVSIPVSRSIGNRPSRLSESSVRFVWRQAITIIRASIMYRPLRTFFSVGFITFLLGITPIVRFLYLYSIGGGSGNIQSLTLGVGLIIVSFIVVALGIIADLIGFNRKLLERNLRFTKRSFFNTVRKDRVR